MRPTKLICAPRDPLEHYAVLDDDACSCSICVAWRKARVVADAAAKKESVEAARRVRYHLQALNARRDLWIESSYHASMHKFGKPYMAWLANETADVRRYYGWWANEASRLPMTFWFERFERAVMAGVTAITGAVSGAFRFTSHYIEIEEEGGGYASLSTLFIDDVDYADDEPDDPEPSFLLQRLTVKPKIPPPVTVSV